MPLDARLIADQSRILFLPGGVNLSRIRNADFLDSDHASETFVGS
jgi:hypothetical protein